MFAILSISVLGIFIIIIVIRKINHAILYKKNYSAHRSEKNNFSKYENILYIRLIDYNKVQGYHFKPKIKKYRGLIITFGGSDGGCLYSLGEEICNKGYEVLSLYYFKHKNLRRQLNNIDISFFEMVLNYINISNIDSSKLTLIGFSKGAELTLLLTQYYEVNNVVLYSPSAYSYQGIGGPSWKYKNTIIPYLKQSDNNKKEFLKIIIKYVFNLPVNYKNLQSYVSENINQDDPEWIYKKKVNGKMLIFAGEDDAVWASSRDAKRLKKYDNEHIDYYVFEGAGHIFSGYKYLGNIYLGGKIISNLKAKEKSDAILFKNLAEWHQED